MYSVGGKLYGGSTLGGSMQPFIKESIVQIFNNIMYIIMYKNNNISLNNLILFYF